MVIEAKRWNHNIHYHPVILEAVPAEARNALDVGCGEGMLARRLSRIVPRVVAIDLHQASLEMAQAHPNSGDVDYLLGDFLTYPFEPASFDVIASVAALHHMDAGTGLLRMRELLRPGGMLAIVGLARCVLPADLPVVLASIIGDGFYRLTRQKWEHPSLTVWPPPETYASMRCLAARLLPGARYRRHLLWRYSLTWTKPLR